MIHICTVDVILLRYLLIKKQTSKIWKKYLYCIIILIFFVRFECIDENIKYDEMNCQIKIISKEKKKKTILERLKEETIFEF